MKNSLQLVLNAILFLAVAVLFYLHFANKPAAAPARQPVAAVKTDDTTAAAVVTEEPAALTAVADTDKVAYVESGKLLDGYQGMKDARRSFEAKAKRWEAQNQTLVQGFQSAVQKYQQQAAGMTAEQRANTEQQLQGRQAQVAQEQEKLQRQAQEEEAKMTQQVLERINKQVEVYGKQNGYRLILIAAPSGTIAYGRKDLDITTPVLKHLNAEYSSKKK
ncbi:OmpH family outer membrane protein [Hymenobacter taeanensis]|uniref:OmpH family outer membrane protein n=1 Tax=Hymenobacter taeanensis TaxID=2735321 RepID=A0A6M6BGQ0_9BACT|nr:MULTISPECIES: OmpH family outer membrane protein [Hymenobacter]QJX47407.1 OmpH family outer membrane protein [Hymenobacter taeanensis]UOQ79253.1 OmpH family outer membrane protein [Hymenobacter sp. 5414T-23]